jgi:hypothetical protein
MSDDTTPSANGSLEAKRDTIRQSLNEITTELNSALVQARLAYPVYLCVPTTGDAIVTFACPLDPDDDEWTRITEIVREIAGKKIGTTKLQTRSLACAMAGATMGAAEIG